MEVRVPIHNARYPVLQRLQGSKVSPRSRPALPPHGAIHAIIVLPSHFEVSASRATVIVRLPFRICLQAIRRDRVETFTSAEPSIMSVVAGYEGDNLLMSNNPPNPNKVISFRA